ncbi:hypothetical protein [Flavivirga rizhaonensis]|uniref:Uncharacterized protein n=1 Tax=Flavivirga rizhaonensis TaxID=2559571 RepID=A0A4S1E0N9_9FLAO|nr:hypothetical protein [Flavivirga rizhaonensis]TGV04136.1 hypothetical protein EM932_03080 [Flavivirga rizhaonensis]
MEIAIFQQYKDGYYTFLFDDGVQLDFEEIHPKALYHYDLKNDNSYVGKSFKLSFIEVFDDRDQALYRIQRLELI